MLQRLPILILHPLDEEVDDEVFIALREKDIDDLIIKKGLTIKFKKKYENFKNSDSETTSKNNEEDDDILALSQNLSQTKIQKESEDNNSREKSTNGISEEQTTKTKIPQVSEDENSDEKSVNRFSEKQTTNNRNKTKPTGETTLEELADVTIEPVPSTSATPDESLSSSTVHASRRQVDTGYLHSTRIEQGIVNARVHELDLIKLLDQSAKGKSVLSMYRHTQQLGSGEYKDITEILCDWLMLLTAFPSKDHFITVRKKIANKFTTTGKANKFMQLIFYVASTEDPEGKGRASGKLFDGMRNLREKLREKYLLPPAKEEPISVIDHYDVEGEEASKDQLDSLAILEKTWEFLQELTPHWRRTSGPRLRKLKNTNGTVAEYTNKYRVIRLPNAAPLVDIDFDHLYPKKLDVLYDEWDVFATKIVNILRATTLSDPIGKELVNELTDSISHETQDLLLCQLLPVLLPGKSTKNVNEGNTKLKITHARDCFLDYLTREVYSIDTEDLQTPKGKLAALSIALHESSSEAELGTEVKSKKRRTNSNNNPKKVKRPKNK
ncbi:uncharacterized protein LOC107043489 [Diachasma alloeum]|uniref:uncharacterized protein LOC107043489 n=1 Tax=Diachasma alloeum TaxID=454923 RepID=UPI00073843A0|nr:uncharacterized protein LOC107043489 [Diachasma alloeum]